MQKYIYNPTVILSSYWLHMFSEFKLILEMFFFSYLKSDCDLIILLA
jgi:hypothetical protein